MSWIEQQRLRTDLTPDFRSLYGRPRETAQSVSGVQCTLFAPPLCPEIRPQ